MPVGSGVPGLPTPEVDSLLNLCSISSIDSLVGVGLCSRGLSGTIGRKIGLSGRTSSKSAHNHFFLSGTGELTGLFMVLLR